MTLLAVFRASICLMSSVWTSGAALLLASTSVLAERPVLARHFSPHSSPVWSQWNPYEMSTDCPRIVLCETGRSGLGDQLERWVFCLHVSQMLNATLALHSESYSHSHGHIGVSEYRRAALLLGIQFKFNQSLAPAPRSIRYEDLPSLGVECDWSIKGSIRSCGHGSWCDNKPNINSLGSVLWMLRQSNASTMCHALNLAWPRRSLGVINVMLHVRSGDICLRCKDVSYYKAIVDTIQRASGAKLELRFESQNKLPELEAAFPNALFTQSSIMEAVCGFLTADVLVTPGSSLSPFVAAFSLPWRPVVFEELRKEVGVVERMLPRTFPVRRHFYSDSEAFLMENGRLTLNQMELSRLLRTRLMTE